MFNIAICTPSTGHTTMVYTQSLAQLILYYSQNPVFADNGKRGMQFLTREGSSIGENRQRMVERAMAQDFTHILFIDEDMGFGPEALYSLARRKLQVVGCNYPMKIPGGDYTAMALDQDHRIFTAPDSTGIEECYYTGFGFCLIDISIFKTLPKPWFMPGYNAEFDEYSTEDTPFFQKIHDYGIKSYVDHDASKMIIHRGFYNYSWEFMVDNQKSKKQENGWLEIA